MAKMAIATLTWFSAHTFLGDRESRKIGNNTTLHTVIDGDYVGYSVRLHGNEIIRVHADYTYTIKDGGWQSATTKDRLNALTPARVWQKAFTWYVNDGVPFVSGMRIDRYGKVVD